MADMWMIQVQKKMVLQATLPSHYYMKWGLSFWLFITTNESLLLPVYDKPLIAKFNRSQQDTQTKTLVKVQNEDGFEVMFGMDFLWKTKTEAAFDSYQRSQVKCHNTN